MDQTLHSMISELERKFHDSDLSSLDEMIGMISSKSNGKVLPPYVPFIGKSYSKHRILVYATAQNISHGHVEKLKWHRPNYRLYPNGDPSESSRDSARLLDIPIEPWRRGILPALVGLFIFAKFGEVIHDLESIQDHVAITNFYKFSLSDQDKDINPVSLLDEVKQKYVRLGTTLVEYELDILRPDNLLWLKGPQRKFLRSKCKQGGINEYELNDPAWILRGHSGCLRNTGSWGKRVDSARNGTSVFRMGFEKAEELVSKYYYKICKLNEKEGRYGAESKGAAIKYYLMRYYLEFNEQR